MKNKFEIYYQKLATLEKINTYPDFSVMQKEIQLLKNYFLNSEKKFPYICYYRFLVSYELILCQKDSSP